jgi:hypothetical protein
MDKGLIIAMMLGAMMKETMSSDNYECTGEYRIPEIGEYYLGDDGKIHRLLMVTKINREIYRKI